MSSLLIKIYNKTRGIDHYIMKTIIITTLTLFCIMGCAIAQKRPLQYSDLDSWVPIENAAITPDGKYVLYYQFFNFKAKGIIKSTTDDWQEEIENAFFSKENCSFTGDSRYAFFQKGQQLARFDFKNLKLNTIDSIDRFVLINTGKEALLLLHSSNNSGFLTVCNPELEVKLKFAGVIEFTISPDNTYLYFIRRENDKYSLYRLDLEKRINRKLYSTEYKIMNVSAGSRGQAAAFEKKSNQYRLILSDQGGQMTFVDSVSAGLDKSFSFFPQKITFGSSGKKLFFSLKKDTPNYTNVSDEGSVDVWNYRDQYDQEFQLRDGFGKPRMQFYACLNIETGKVLRLQQENDMDGPEVNALNDHYVLFRPAFTFYGDSFWKEKDEHYLVNTSTGQRDTIRNAYTNYMRFDPSGKYLYWLSIKDTNSKRGDWWFYNLISGKRRNITEQIPVDSSILERQQPNEQLFTFGDIAGWYMGEDAVLISDNRDLWKVSIKGNCAPENLTGSMGYSNHIQFKYTPLGSRYGNQEAYIISEKQMLLLGQDEYSKNQGLYLLKKGEKPELQKETYGAYTYQIINRSPSGKFVNPEFEMAPVGMPLKAEASSRYIVYRGSIASPPNIYTTTGFNHLKAITDYQPQRKVNWMTSEIHHWQDDKRKNHTAILYKPEDFDSTRKYPVIFYYYEKCSAGLNAFQFPKWSNGSLNIPWFVSNGYLVFVPDMDYVIGEPGKSVTNAIVSGADYLNRFSWVDHQHMGLQGHSYGGYETNFVVTQTSRFAAACAAAGPSDLISLYGSSDWAKDVAENGQNRIGKMPWQGYDLYIKNSPLYYADKVSTPLLLVQSKADWKIPFQSQGISFFSALRRLGKPVWMLQYDKEGHVLSGEAAQDYTIRLTQFFDHFLKGKPAPLWLSKGIPANQKAYLSGTGLSNPEQKK